jgi:hypothetical protein
MHCKHIAALGALAALGARPCLADDAPTYGFPLGFSADKMDR